MDVDFTKIDYLKLGNQRQKKVFKILNKLNILDTLVVFHPLIVGEIPLELDHPFSSIKIICDFDDEKKFKDNVENLYGKFLEFILQRTKFFKNSGVLVKFFFEGFNFEIWGEKISTLKQIKYRQLLVEKKLLTLGGKKNLLKVKNLIQSGLDPESAFARVFKIGGDPTLEILELEDLSEEEIRRLLLKPR